MSSFTPIAPNFQQIVRLILDKILDTEHYPRFHRYYEKLRNPRQMERYLLYQEMLFRLAKADVRGHLILDMGCGFCLAALLWALGGAREVHGVDIRPEEIETAEIYLAKLPMYLSVFPKLGDVIQTGYPDERFDLVISTEAVSHFRDRKGFLREAHRVLKPGGLLIIADSNHGLNPWVRWKTQRVWDRFENGPPTDNIYGHRVLKPFVVERAERLREAFPELTEGEASRLARATTGMWGEEILSAGRMYIATGQMPTRVYQPGTCPLSPSGQYIEYLIDPYQFAKEIETVGFQTKTYLNFFGAGGRRLGEVNAILQRMPMAITRWFARGFVIIGRKLYDRG